MVWNAEKFTVHVYKQDKDDPATWFSIYEIYDGKFDRAVVEPYLQGIATGLCIGKAHG